jgi:predicted RNA methylase
MSKKVDQNVLEVLSGLTVRGNLVTMSTQLDRKMYLKVNEVLAALGGKWERSMAAHVFDGNPQEALDNVIDTGEFVRDKDLGFFATPPELALKLVELAEVEEHMTVLEPSAGEGAIVAALRDVGADVWAYEIDRGRFDKLAKRFSGKSNVIMTLQDFMKATPGPLSVPFDRVVMNPPFCKVEGADHIHHVQRALSWLKPGGVLVSVLPASVSFRQDRRYREFRDWYKGHKGVLRDLPDGSFKASGTGVKTVVLKMEAKT